MSNYSKWITVPYWLGIVAEPIGRRFVILLTACPVVAGLFAVSLIAVLNGNSFQVWILVKCTVLVASMPTSYVLAGREMDVSRGRGTGR